MREKEKGKKSIVESLALVTGMQPRKTENNKPSTVHSVHQSSLPGRVNAGWKPVRKATRVTSLFFSLLMTHPRVLERAL
jgi:hypothetical protein